MLPAREAAAAGLRSAPAAAFEHPSRSSFSARRRLTAPLPGRGVRQATGASMWETDSVSINDTLSHSSGMSGVSPTDEKTRTLLLKTLIISGMMALVAGPISFFILRFLLGVAEAGFFPGIIFYFTGWFPAQYRARAISGLFVAVPVANGLARSAISSVG